jgi:hypothetical protein
MWSMGMGVVDEGPSEAARLIEVEESDCIDRERCLFRLAEFKSVGFEEGDAAGDGRVMTFKEKSLECFRGMRKQHEYVLLKFPTGGPATCHSGTGGWPLTLMTESKDTIAAGLMSYIDHGLLLDLRVLRYQLI